MGYVGSYYNILKAIFYLLKGDYNLMHYRITRTVVFVGLLFGGSMFVGLCGWGVAEFSNMPSNHLSIAYMFNHVFSLSTALPLCIGNFFPSRCQSYSLNHFVAKPSSSNSSNPINRICSAKLLITSSIPYTSDSYPSDQTQKSTP